MKTLTIDTPTGSVPISYGDGVNLNVVKMTFAMGAVLASQYSRQVEVAADEVNASVRQARALQGVSQSLDSVSSTGWTLDLLKSLIDSDVDPPKGARVVVTTSSGSYVADLTWPALSQDPGAGYPMVAFTSSTGSIKFRDSSGVLQSINSTYGVSVFNATRVSEEQDRVRKEITSKLESFTQVSQTKQLYLQDLLACYERFYSLGTNVQQRRERDTQDILARF